MERFIIDDYSAVGWVEREKLSSLSGYPDPRSLKHVFSRRRQRNPTKPLLEEKHPWVSREPSAFRKPLDFEVHWLCRIFRGPAFTPTYKGCSVFLWVVLTCVAAIKICGPLKTLSQSDTNCPKFSKDNRFHLDTDYSMIPNLSNVKIVSVCMQTDWCAYG